MGDMENIPQDILHNIKLIMVEFYQMDCECGGPASSRDLSKK
jgi:hypothetical protein